MNQRKFKLVALLVLLVAGAYWHAQFVYTKIVLSNQPQEAVFYIAPGYTGGLDSTPLVLSSDNTKVVELSGRQVYFENNSAWQDAAQSKIISCASGRPKIRVVANINIKDAEAWPSVPGEDAKYPVPYYLVQANKIHSITVRPSTCATP